MQLAKKLGDNAIHPDHAVAGAFAIGAQEAHAAGLTVIPTALDNAKKPLVRNWQRFRHQHPKHDHEMG